MNRVARVETASRRSLLEVSPDAGEVTEPAGAKMSEEPETSVGGLQRRARALLGWMTSQEAKLVQSGRRMDADSDPAHEERARRAREIVAARPSGIDQAGALVDAPAALDNYLAELRTHEVTRGMFDDGYSVALVDLRQICAIQPNIFSDQADERVRDVDPTDLEAVARVSLPIPDDQELPAQFDEATRAWILSAPNPNLRIVGPFAGPVGPGVVGFGFGVRLLPSFVQVARFQGRYLLRDGYHRAYGFLRRDVPLVPAFVREFASFEELTLNPGMLPQGSYLGERPPRLVDYLDDDVATDVLLPAAQKMIVIHGLEISPLG
jgi:hypothetical protein